MWLTVRVAPGLTRITALSCALIGVSSSRYSAPALALVDVRFAVHFMRLVKLSFIAVKLNVSLKTPGRLIVEDKSLVSVMLSLRSALKRILRIGLHSIMAEGTFRRPLHWLSTIWPSFSSRIQSMLSEPRLVPPNALGTMPNGFSWDNCLFECFSLSLNEWKILEQSKRRLVFLRSARGLNLGNSMNWAS